MYTIKGPGVRLYLCISAAMIMFVLFLFLLIQMNDGVVTLMFTSVLLLTVASCSVSLDFEKNQRSQHLTGNQMEALSLLVRDPCLFFHTVQNSMAGYIYMAEYIYIPKDFYVTKGLSSLKL